MEGVEWYIMKTSRFSSFLIDCWSKFEKYAPLKSEYKLSEHFCIQFLTKENTRSILFAGPSCTNVIYGALTKILHTSTGHYWRAPRLALLSMISNNSIAIAPLIKYLFRIEYFIQKYNFNILFFLHFIYDRRNYMISFISEYFHEEVKQKNV